MGELETKNPSSRVLHKSSVKQNRWKNIIVKPGRGTGRRCSNILQALQTVVHQRNAMTNEVPAQKKRRISWWISSMVCGFFFSLTYAPRISYHRPWEHFSTVKKSSFEKAQTILLGFLKYFSTAVMCFLKCGFCKRISATPKERFIPPPKAPLFGALGRAITNWRNHYPLHIPWTTGDNQFCQIKKLYIYMARPRRPQTLTLVGVIWLLDLTLKNKNRSWELPPEAKLWRPLTLYMGVWGCPCTKGAWVGRIHSTWTNRWPL